MTTREWFRKLRSAEWGQERGPVDVMRLAQSIEDRFEWQYVDDPTRKRIFGWSYCERKGDEWDMLRAFDRALDSHGFRRATGRELSAFESFYEIPRPALSVRVLNP